MEMFNYYLKLSFRNLIRNRLFFILMISTLAVGVGVFLANIAIIKSMSSDPIPYKSDRIFNVSLNIWSLDNPDAELIEVMRYNDAMHILKNDIATHTMVHYQSKVYTRDINAKSLTRHQAIVRATTQGFFPLTDAPFAFGGVWQQDYAKQIVIGDTFNQQVFGGGNSVGKTLEIGGKPFEIVGVLKPWNLKPVFYNAAFDQAFNSTDDIYAPIETAMDNEWAIDLRNMSTDRIHSVSDNRGKNGFFLQAFVQLDTLEQKQLMQQYLDNYSQHRKAQGEYLRANDNRLLDVNEWLTHQKVVDERMLAFALASSLFLAVCIFNASSLLLARYHSARFETGLRRAVGARMKDVFYQGVVESMLIGSCCAVLTLLFGWLFLQISMTLFPALKQTSDIDITLILMGIGIALVTSFISMLYPLIRSCRTSLSTTLK
ncbi:ABC transporter permease [Colwellia sp. 4_MG-2023]|uniref:ABC transporter permease n=1 Tax=unclassified Colwellia TaxID=196834 RepID=UPI001C0807A6|nr:MULTISPECIES: ABC transporter permease [unclassified Colwellia]MBU2925784.1 ABC transporter permease [Colwellia sp. C2M11]MDO6505566.1 ABC transporter permease [Colwellia sp. 5_MG-2023]MDO6554138.1 ABC transporter permease [Colwellia sp. 4_MG-2023]MDO6650990.1 ABC transporter permease [Colwellia sp. 3_MG-2023]MDO6664025.1 ABC transporter permease [Colwellia sp. 2_MG-2023]